MTLQQLPAARTPRCCRAPPFSKLLDTPIQWVAAHGFEQLGRGVHGGQSITRNINCQAVPTWVLAQSSNVPFVPFENVPFGDGDDARGDDRVELAGATPAEGHRGGHGPAADAGGGRVAVGTHHGEGEAPGGGVPCGMGAAGLVSRRVGQPSNRRLKEPLREAIRALLVERYPD